MDKPTFALVDFLPRTVTYLCFTHDFDLPILDRIPPTIDTVSFGSQFNQSLAQLPPSVTTVIIRGNYTFPLETLPESVRVIFLGKMYIRTLSFLSSFVELLVFLGNRKTVPEGIPDTLKGVIFTTTSDTKTRQFIRCIPATIDFIGISYHLRRNKFWEYRSHRVHFLKF
jgi:hypothetical protein